MKKLIQSLVFKASNLPKARAVGFWTLGFGLLTLVGGCAVGPNYKRPPINAPATFRGETDVATNSFADLPWWQVFHDDTLQSLIRTALTNNYDLRIAVTRVEQARALAAQARAQFLPASELRRASPAAGKMSAAATLPSPIRHRRRCLWRRRECLVGN